VASPHSFLRTSLNLPALLWGCKRQHIQSSLSPCLSYSPGPKKDLTLLKVVESSLVHTWRSSFLGGSMEKFRWFPCGLEIPHCNDYLSTLVTYPLLEYSLVTISQFLRPPLLWQCQEIWICIRTFKMKCERDSKFFCNGLNSHVSC
jgi:hypothetical protein